MAVGRQSIPLFYFKHQRNQSILSTTLVLIFPSTLNKTCFCCIYIFTSDLIPLIRRDKNRGTRFSVEWLCYCIIEQLSSGFVTIRTHVISPCTELYGLMLISLFFQRSISIRSLFVRRYCVHGIKSQPIIMMLMMMMY